jgi:hypothetical protein
MLESERRVVGAIGARLRSVGKERYSIEFLNDDGSVRAVRPASPLEVRMWLLLITRPTAG